MAKTNPVEFFRQVRNEAGRVTWPTRKETMVTVTMVIIMAVISALFFLAADGAIHSVIQLILG